MKAPTQHILLIRLSSVGDIVLATPLVPVLRKHYPSARISWLADAGYTDLLRKNPFLDRVIEFDRRGRHWGPRGIARLAAEVGNVDWVIDLQHKIRTRVLVALLRPRCTSVLVKRHGLAALKAILGRDPISTNPHQIFRYLQVIVDSRSLRLSDDHRHIPAPRLWLDSGVLQETTDRLTAEAAGLPLLGIVVGSRHAVKRWPARHVARLAEIAFNAGLRPVMLGGEEDGEAIRMVAPVGGTSQALVMVGGSLMRLAAAIACCAVVVAPDSGPAHMAAALGIPVVTLFGPTAPARWAPPGSRSRVVRLELPCSPCSNHGGASCPIKTHECLEALQPEKVFAEVQSLLSEVT
jgi:heptosyltransferase-2